MAEQNQNLEKLKEITNRVSETCWKCMDKYLCAGFAMLNQNLATVKGEELTFTTNEGGSLVLGADYAKLFDEAVKQYGRYYKEIISKSGELKQLPFLATPAQNETVKIDSFEWLTKQKYESSEMEKTAHNYWAMAKKIADIGAKLQELTKMPHEKFFNEIKQVAETLSGGADLFKNATKLKLAAEPQGDPDGVEIEKVEEQPEEEKQEEQPQVDQNVVAGVETAAKEVAAVIDHPDNVGPNFEKMKQDLERLKAAYEKSGLSKKMRKKINAFREQNKGILPAVWAYAAGTGQLDNVKRIIEAAQQQQELLKLLFENEEGENDRPGDTGDGVADTPQEDAGEEENNDQKKTDGEETAPNEKQDNPAEKAKTLADAAGKLLTIKKANGFITEYGKWVKAVNEFFAGLAENEDLKPELEKLKDLDPYEKIVKTYALLLNHKEEKKEEAYDPFVDAFMKRLDEKLHRR